MNFPYSDRIMFLPDENNIPFSGMDRSSVMSAMQSIYTVPLARKMIDSWFSKNNILQFVYSYSSSYGRTFPPDPGVLVPGGQIGLNFRQVEQQVYITPRGRTANFTLEYLLTHELVHVMKNLFDDVKLFGPGGNYAGATVDFANKIYPLLGLPKQLSYVGAGSVPSDFFLNSGEEVLKRDYNYTNNQEINTALVLSLLRSEAFGFEEPPTDWSTVHLGNSRDLLIGDLGGNKLISGQENDFLWGMGGADTLDGGDGIDTAGYYQARADFKILPGGNLKKFVLAQTPGTGVITEFAGTDTLENIEQIQFGKKVFKVEQPQDIVILTDLAAAGINYQSMTAMIQKAVSDNNTVFSDTRVKIFAYGVNGLLQSEFFDNLQTLESRRALNQFLRRLNYSDSGDSSLRYDNQQILNVLSSNASQWRDDVEKKVIAISSSYDSYSADEDDNDPNLSTQVQNVAAQADIQIDRIVSGSSFYSSGYSHYDPGTGFDFENTAGAVMQYSPYASAENPGNLDKLLNASFNDAEIGLNLESSNSTVSYGSLAGGAVIGDLILTGGELPEDVNLTYDIIAGHSEQDPIDHLSPYAHTHATFGIFSVRNNQLVVKEDYTPDPFNPVEDLFVGSTNATVDFAVAISGLSTNAIVYDKISFEITGIPVYGSGYWGY